MDLIRYVLSTAVIIAHINILAGYDIFFPITSFEAVGGFFALSGFLMYPNYIRHNSFKKYTAQRARRILPPYFFIVVLCALSMVAISSFSVENYYLSRQWWKYIIANLSFLNWLQPSLPGVFSGPEYYEPAVNGSLWTMKVEWCLYFSVPIFIFLLRRFRFNRKWLAAVVIIISIAYRILFTHLYDNTGKAIFEILARQVFGQLAYFYCGMLIYFYKDFLSRHYLVLLIVGLSLFFVSNSSNWIVQSLLNPPAVASIVMALCLMPINLNFLSRIPNVSYEMYLFHFPIIQLGVYYGINRGEVLQIAVFVFSLTILLSLIWTYTYRHLAARVHHSNNVHAAGKTAK